MKRSGQSRCKQACGWMITLNTWWQNHSRNPTMSTIQLATSLASPVYRHSYRHNDEEQSRMMSGMGVKVSHSSSHVYVTPRVIIADATAFVYRPRRYFALPCHLVKESYTNNLGEHLRSQEDGKRHMLYMAVELIIRTSLPSDLTLRLSPIEPVHRFPTVQMRTTSRQLSREGLS